VQPKVIVLGRVVVGRRGHIDYSRVSLAFAPTLLNQLDLVRRCSRSSMPASAAMIASRILLKVVVEFSLINQGVDPRNFHSPIILSDDSTNV
jgi:hypothetical protein